MLGQFSKLLLVIKGQLYSFLGAMICIMEVGLWSFLQHIPLRLENEV